MASNTNKYKVMNYQACRPAVLWDRLKRQLWSLIWT
jgi:hypothetical protein